MKKLISLLLTLMLLCALPLALAQSPAVPQELLGQWVCIELLMGGHTITVLPGSYASATLDVREDNTATITYADEDHTTDELTLVQQDGTWQLTDLAWQLADSSVGAPLTLDETGRLLMDTSDEEGQGMVIFVRPDTVPEAVPVELTDVTLEDVLGRWQAERIRMDGIEAPVSALVDDPVALEFCSDFTIQHHLGDESYNLGDYTLQYIDGQLFMDDGYEQVLMQMSSDGRLYMTSTSSQAVLILERDLSDFPVKDMAVTIQPDGFVGYWAYDFDRVDGKNIGHIVSGGEQSIHIDEQGAVEFRDGETTYEGVLIPEGMHMYMHLMIGGNSVVTKISLDDEGHLVMHNPGQPGHEAVFSAVELVLDSVHPAEDFLGTWYMAEICVDDLVLPVAASGLTTSMQINADGTGSIYPEMEESLTPFVWLMQGDQLNLTFDDNNTSVLTLVDGKLRMEEGNNSWGIFTREAPEAVVYTESIARTDAVQADFLGDWDLAMCRFEGNMTYRPDAIGLDIALHITEDDITIDTTMWENSDAETCEYEVTGGLLLVDHYADLTYTLREDGTLRAVSPQGEELVFQSIDAPEAQPTETSAPAASPIEPMLGMWYGTQEIQDRVTIDYREAGIHATMTVNADGTARLTRNGTTEDYTWEVKGDEIVVSQSWDGYRFFLDGEGQLHLYCDDAFLATDMTFVREDPQIPDIVLPAVRTDVQPGEFLGQWTLEKLYRLYDGSVVLMPNYDALGLTERFTIYDDCLLLERSHDNGFYLVWEYPCSAQGHQLMIADETISLLEDGRMLHLSSDGLSGYLLTRTGDAVPKPVINPDDFCGQWYGQALCSAGGEVVQLDPATMSMSAEIREDGTATFSSFGTDTEYTWVATSFGLLLTDEYVTTIPLSLTADGGMVAGMAELNASLLLTRVAAPAATISPIRTDVTMEDFVGVWTHDKTNFMGMIIEAEESSVSVSFAADGSTTIGEGSAENGTTITIDGSTITTVTVLGGTVFEEQEPCKLEGHMLIAGDGSSSYPLVLREDGTLTCTQSDEGPEAWADAPTLIFTPVTE